jgi:hypothetical protein
VRRPVPSLYSRPSNSFSHFALRRPDYALALSARRLPYLVPIVQMSVCTNLGLDRSSHLAAYAGYVVLRARINAHSRSLTPYLHGIVPIRVCANCRPYQPSRLAAYTGHVMLVGTLARCERIVAH